MARMHAKCLILGAIIALLISPFSFPRSANALDIRSSRHVDLTGFNLTVFESGKQAGLLSCVTTSGGTLDPVSDSCPASSICPAELAVAPTPARKVEASVDPKPRSKAFSRAVYGLLESSVLDVEVVSSYAPHVAGFFFAVYRNATFEIESALTSILTIPRTDHRFDLYIYQPVVDTEDRIIASTAFEADIEDLMFVEFPDEYWRYYEDCDRWGVVFNPGHKAGSMIAAESVEENSQDSEPSPIVNSLVNAIRHQLDKTYRYWSTVLDEAYFVVVESPALVAPSVVNDTDEIVARPNAPVATKAGLLSAAIQAGWVLNEQLGLHKPDALSLDWFAEVLTLANELEEKLDAAEREEAELKRYLAPRLKWLSQAIGEVAEGIDATGTEQIAEGPNSPDLK